MNKAKERNTDKARGNAAGDRVRLIRAGAIGAGGGVLLSILLLLLFALIAVKREDPVARAAFARQTAVAARRGVQRAACRPFAAGSGISFVR